MIKVITISLTILCCVICYSPTNASFGQVFNDQLETLENCGTQLYNGAKPGGSFSSPSLGSGQLISYQSIQQFSDLVPKFRKLRKLTSSLKQIEEITEEDSVIMDSLKRTVFELTEGLSMANATLLDEFEFLSSLPQYDESIESSQGRRVLFQRSLERISNTFLRVINYLRTTITNLSPPPNADWSLKAYCTNLNLLADTFMFGGAILGGIHFLLVRSLGGISQYIQMDHALLLTHTFLMSTTNVTNCTIPLMQSDFNSTAPNVITTIHKVDNSFLVVGSFVGACGLLLKALARCNKIYQENRAARQVAPSQQSSGTHEKILEIELEEIEEELRWIIDQAHEHLTRFTGDEGAGTALGAITRSSTTGTTTTSSGTTTTTTASSGAASTRTRTDTTSRLSDETTEQ